MSTWHTVGTAVGWRVWHMWLIVVAVAVLIIAHGNSYRERAGKVLEAEEVNDRMYI